MTDTVPNDLLDVMRDSFEHVTMDVPLESVRAAGRARRMRRRMVAGGVVAAAAVVAGAGVALTAAPSTAADPGQVHVHLAAWSVDSQPNGTVAIDIREIFDAPRLESTLAAAGVPAIVNDKQNCDVTGGQFVDPGQVIDWRPGPDGGMSLIVNKSAMPAGSKMVFEVNVNSRQHVSQGSGHVVVGNTPASKPTTHAKLQAVAWGLSSPGSVLTCH